MQASTFLRRLTSMAAAVGAVYSGKGRCEAPSSLLLARIGEERLAITAQDDARRTLPKSLPRFATHLELHQALMLVRSGDRETGVAHARAAMANLPRAKHSQSLRLMLAEIEH